GAGDHPPCRHRRPSTLAKDDPQRGDRIPVDRPSPAVHLFDSESACRFAPAPGRLTLTAAAPATTHHNPAQTPTAAPPSLPSGDCYGCTARYASYPPVCSSTLSTLAHPTLDAAPI